MKVILIAVFVVLAFCEITEGRWRTRRLIRQSSEANQTVQPPMTPKQWEEKMQRKIKDSGLSEPDYYMRAV
jgi:hypothetical protein